jgi:DNA-directed RNA polymerase subunit M/transcription elongation factor TFIIS
MIKCTKCGGKMFVDRVFTSHDHLELYCLKCGKRDMYHNPQKYGKKIQWIIEKEREIAKKNGNHL